MMYSRKVVMSLSGDRVPSVRSAQRFVARGKREQIGHRFI